MPTLEAAFVAGAMRGLMAVLVLAALVLVVSGPIRRRLPAERRVPAE